METLRQLTEALQARIDFCAYVGESKSCMFDVLLQGHSPGTTRYSNAITGLEAFARLQVMRATKV